ncbi:MAG: hypothetical protein LR001_07165 [Clostridiales bacterium]|nr:hypothetical protein [Clostridiales bacterium]
MKRIDPKRADELTFEYKPSTELEYYAVYVILVFGAIAMTCQTGRPVGAFFHQIFS